MTGHDDWDELLAWVEHLTEAELLKRSAWETADFYVLADTWLIATPDDPKMRDWLIEEEGCSPEEAALVLARMRVLGRERGLLDQN
jgi:hypothetical protein